MSKTHQKKINLVGLIKFWCVKNNNNFVKTQNTVLVIFLCGN
jgi:hypothetical protein